MIKVYLTKSNGQYSIETDQGYFVGMGSRRPSAKSIRAACRPAIGEAVIIEDRSKRFEDRFEGPSNKGLRAMIRRAVAGTKSCPAAAAAVRALAKKVALTAQGAALLELVARDYDPKP